MLKIFNPNVVNMFRFLLIVFFFPMISMGQSFHPESSDPGCCSEKTRIPYTYDPSEADITFQLFTVNKSSEKSLFYQGKYDPWKSPFNKKNPLFDQIYIFPPSTLPISKGIFLDQTEVANIHYQEFLYYIEKDSGKDVRTAYEPRLENKYKYKYYNNPEFYFFPVVGVSYEDAQAFCEWRANKLNSGLKEMLVGSPKKYRYSGRLPRLPEWQKAAGEASEFVKDVHYTLGKNEKAYLEEDVIPNRFATSSVLEKDELYAYNANFRVEPPIGLELEIPLYIYSFEPNERGFYNMYGNVKEILEEGNAVGGSFKEAFDSSKLFQEDDTQAYRTDVGFRCICEIARRKI